jgi:sugar lactone lactonase YvrE
VILDMRQHRPALDEVHELAEGPLWDPIRQRLLWVDILRELVLVGRLDATGAIAVEDRVRFDGAVSAVAPATDGRWIVAVAQGTVIRQTSGAISPHVTVIDEGGSRRLNDGKPDPRGRFVVGTLSTTGAVGHESLVSIREDGTVQIVDDDLTLSNGLAWSTDGTTMYSIDTLRSVVFRREYDPATGTPGARSVFLEIRDGDPDGMCVDAEDHLWIAIWGAGEVRRYTPSGELDSVILVPAPNASSVAFAGPDLGTLVITTASAGLDAEMHASFPESGKLFTVRPGVTGHPPSLWNGIFEPEGTAS